MDLRSWDQELDAREDAVESIETSEPTLKGRLSEEENEELRETIDFAVKCVREIL